MVKIWKAWKKIAEIIGNVQFQIIFSFFYFALLLPLGLITDFLNDFLKKNKKSSWNKVEDSFSNLDKLKKQ